MNSCIFCNLSKEKIILENEYTQAFFDEFPVSKGHMLIIPKRHVSSFFDLTKQEHDAVLELLQICKKKLEKLYAPNGYNIGVNIGEYAGQSIFHVHIHLIPRYKGDTPNPRGGIRGVIPSKQNY